MFSAIPIVDYHCNPPHVDGYEIFLEDKCVAIFWSNEAESMEMLKKLNNEPSNFNVKLRLEPLKDPQHFFLIERGNCHILWGEVFLDFDAALNILGKLND